MGEDRETLICKVEAYRPWNEQEEADKREVLRLLKNVPDLFLRENRQCHMTASAWVVNADRSRVLMAYHNIYDSWSWLGGHADGQPDLLAVAVKEVMEESGVRSVRPVSREIYSLEILTVNGHRKKGQYVPSHLHLNVTYLLEADDAEKTQICPEENSRIAWFEREEAVAASTEDWIREHIYRKLNDKLTAFVKTGGAYADQKNE